MSADSETSGSPDRFVSRMREIDALQLEAEQELQASPTALIATAALDFVPGAGAVIQKLVDKQAQRQLAVSRRIAEALWSLNEDIAERVVHDPSFPDFAGRVIVQAQRVEHREKIDYYIRLLRASAPASGPDEDERARLLDTLDAMRLHHLRLFHTIATEQADTRDVGEEIWDALAHRVGADREGLRLDWTVLDRLGLVTLSGWGISTTFRLQLTDFGLLFENLVSMESPRRRPRWEVEVVDDKEGVTGEIARDFAAVSDDPRFVRERGGYYLVSREFDDLDDPLEVRRRADAFLIRVVQARRLTARQHRPVRVGSVLERGIPRYSEAPSGRPERDEDTWPRPPIIPIVERLRAQNAAVEEIVSRFAAAAEAAEEWEIAPDNEAEKRAWSLIDDCLTALEASYGGPLPEYPGANPEYIGEVRASARARHESGDDAQRVMGLRRAVGLVGESVAAYVYVTSGVWPRLTPG